MIYQLKPYIDVILSERTWSWSLVGILYVLAGFFVRSWFLSPVTSRCGKLDKKLSRTVKSSYLKYSLLGWIFFFIPLGLFTLLWRNLLPPKINDIAVISGAAAAFILSVIFHLQAFGIAGMIVLKQYSDHQKEKNLFEG